MRAGIAGPLGERSGLRYTSDIYGPEEHQPMPKAKSSSAQRRRKEALRRKRRQERRTARTGADMATFDSVALEAIRQKGIVPAGEITFNPPGQRKMSEALEELIAPYLEMTDNLEEFTNLVNLGTLAWNMALLPAEEQADFLELTMKVAPRDLRTDFAKLLRLLVLRKVALFPDDHREILSIEVTDLGDKYHLAVQYLMRVEAT